LSLYEAAGAAKAGEHENDNGDDTTHGLLPMQLMTAHHLDKRECLQMKSALRPMSEIDGSVPVLPLRARALA
jgi:hypothetical protein